MAVLGLVYICAAAQAGEPTVFRHMDDVRNCVLCHDRKSNSKLHLMDGTPVAKDDSALLCGQCHGHTYADWKENLHGKRTGSWKKEGGPPSRALNCVACHEPHSPKYEPVTPLPAPRLPKMGGRKSEEVLKK